MRGEGRGEGQSDDRAGSADTANGAGTAVARIAIARFFAENFAVHAPALERSITEGADPITADTAALE
jgi:acyl-CoA dehydrogenase